MSLLSRELLTAFARQGRTEGKSEEEIMVLAHYFAAGWDWWATEYAPETRTFFGLSNGFTLELVSFSMSQMESISRCLNGVGGAKRDLCYRPKSLAEVRRRIDYGQGPEPVSATPK